MRLNCGELLELLMCSLEPFTRSDCGYILAGLRVTKSSRRVNELLARMKAQQWVEQQGRGKDARFTVTTEGTKRVTVEDPTRQWNKPWDKKWRVFSYDLPETRRKDRVKLWRALRATKLGLLQRSTWVWPHDVEPILRDLIQAQGIPDCFCGFESERLLLCVNKDVVAAAWDFREIGSRHLAYLKHQVASPESLRSVRDLATMARVVRVERQAYQYAYSIDPLLPRALWPKGYRGPAVEETRQIFRKVLRRRLSQFIG